jgi:AcrR family transcriptional regulator
MAERLAPHVRRERILATAMSIISEEGYRGLTLRGLARRCGMSAPGLMHHFADLPTLLLAVLDYRDERDIAVVFPEVGDQPGSRALLDRIVARMATDPLAAQLFATLEAESLDPHHPAHDYFTERRESVVDALEKHLTGDFEEPYDAARLIVAILDGLQLHWLQDPEGFDLQAQWAVVADSLFATRA